jgi:hypothetical protein
MFRRRAWLVCFAAVACGGAAATPANDAGDAGIAQDASFTDVSGDVADAAVVTPIMLADEWVAGWYQTSYRGTNVYSHVDGVGYPNGYYTQWRGDPGITLYANVTDCSSFSDVLLTRAFGWGPPTTNPRPLAADYYWAIRNAVRFEEIDDVNELEVGDVLTLLYGTTDSDGDTGHVAWVDALPQPYSDGPIETNLSQFAITIVDSADGFHYAPPDNAANQDDRYLGTLDGGQCTTDAECIVEYGSNAVCNSTSTDESLCAYTGVGRGQLRLYADASGNIAGYTWGTSNGSVFYPRPDPVPAQGVAFSGRDIVAGRYVGPMD